MVRARLGAWLRSAGPNDARFGRQFRIRAQFRHWVLQFKVPKRRYVLCSLTIMRYLLCYYVVCRAVEVFAHGHRRLG